MEVSTFELLVKAIAPRKPSNPITDEVARRVVQGYFLTVTNLEPQDLKLQIEFYVSLPDKENPNPKPRLLEANTMLVYDIAFDRNEKLDIKRVDTGNKKVAKYIGEFKLPAGQTASVQLLPDLANGILGDPDPQLEIRGYAALVNVTPSKNKAPVKVLLSPEIRGTFLPNALEPGKPLDFDQIAYALPLASGKALNSIEYADAKDKPKES
ncbi:hypothetical protein H6F90_12850 [Trichocoleus sp. FACHB-591]|uniref:hypothetical protein n=1 Tax=Trichocoleus sp. FACHB-591 TaxID=2692872 RepID=UPI001686A746|nr:hypothetical protein [Trichocoleus sp. FACHB-591]MBD2096034.1 hypothetical protein [Trichocoleus sp. FACHB-591]